MLTLATSVEPLIYSITGPAIFAQLKRFPLYGGKNVLVGSLKLVEVSSEYRELEVPL